MCYCSRCRGEADRLEITDFDAAFGEAEPVANGENLVEYNEDAVSETQTENGVRDLEGKHNLPLQFMKEQVLGNVSEPIV